MIDRQLALKTRRKRRRPSISQPEDVYGLPVPKALGEAIETERENLSRVEALLACMVVAMECQPNPHAGPYYPDVAQIARELVARSINALDPFILKRRLLNKVEEGHRVAATAQSYAHLHRLPARHLFLGSFALCE